MGLHLLELGRREELLGVLPLLPAMEDEGRRPGLLTAQGAEDSRPPGEWAAGGELRRRREPLRWLLLPLLDCCGCCKLKVWVLQL